MNNISIGQGPILVSASGFDLGSTLFSTGLEPCFTTHGVDVGSTNNVSIGRGPILVSASGDDLGSIFLSTGLEPCFTGGDLSTRCISGKQLERALKAVSKQAT